MKLFMATIILYKPIFYYKRFSPTVGKIIFSRSSNYKKKINILYAGNSLKMKDNGIYKYFKNKQ